MRPLLLFGVLYVFFTVIGHVGSGADAQPGQPNHFYGMQLLASIVLFTFFSRGDWRRGESVLDREALVRKIQFPRMVIPLSIVLGALFNLGLNLIVVLVFALASGVRPMLTLARDSADRRAARDIRDRTVDAPIVAVRVFPRRGADLGGRLPDPVLLLAGDRAADTRCSSELSPALVKVYMLNPLATIFQQFRHAVINHATPSAGAILGTGGVLVVVAIVFAVFALGFVVFNRTAPYVAENL